MEIVVEIGNDEEKDLIRKEIQYFYDISQALNLRTPIIKTIVPLDIQESIRLFSKKEDYQTTRGVGDQSITVTGKILYDNDGAIIVMSPDLYSENNDTLTRAFIFFHEAIHILNKDKLQIIDDGGLPTFSTYYIKSATFLFDEYIADRSAYFIVNFLYKDKGPSSFWENKIDHEAIDYINIFQVSPYYDWIRDEISKFRSHSSSNFE